MRHNFEDGNCSLPGVPGPRRRAPRLPRRAVIAKLRKPRKEPKLSKRSSDLLEEFSAAAKTRGWESDQGTGRSVDNAEAAFAEARLALMRRIASLEKLEEAARLDRRVRRGL